MKERRKRERLPLQTQTPRRRAQNARQSRRASTTTTTASRADRAEQTEPSRRRPSRRTRADRRRRRRRTRRAIIPLHAASREAAQDIRRADRAADRERLQAEQDGNADRDRRRRWEAGNGQPPGFSFNIKLSRRDDPAKAPSRSRRLPFLLFHGKKRAAGDPAPLRMPKNAELVLQINY